MAFKRLRMIDEDGCEQGVIHALDNSEYKSKRQPYPEKKWGVHFDDALEDITIASMEHRWPIEDLPIIIYLICKIGKNTNAFPDISQSAIGRKLKIDRQRVCRAMKRLARRNILLAVEGTKEYTLTTRLTWRGNSKERETFLKNVPPMILGKLPDEKENK